MKKPLEIPSRLTNLVKLVELVEEWQRAEAAWHKAQDTWERVPKGNPFTKMKSGTRLYRLLDDYAKALLAITRADEALRKWRR